MLPRSSSLLRKLAPRLALISVMAVGWMLALGVAGSFATPDRLAIMSTSVGGAAVLASAVCVLAYATGYPLYRLGRRLYGRWRPGRVAPRSWRIWNVIWLVCAPPTGVFYLAVVLVAVLAFFNPFLRPDDIRIADPARAVEDARRMMQQGPPASLKPEELPESLRLPGLRWALVAHDHVSLVLGASPDHQAGARIWSIDARPTHGDQPTKYKDVFFYVFDKERPESPTNVP